MLQKWICNKCKNYGGKKGKTLSHTTQRARIAICPVCNKEFRAIQEYKGRISIYCSKECWSKRSIVINKCKYCGKHTIDLEAHHIKEQSRYPELIYELSNGLTLCHKCHKLTDNYGYKARWKNLEAEKIE